MVRVRTWRCYAYDALQSVWLAARRTAGAAREVADIDSNDKPKRAARESQCFDLGRHEALTRRIDDRGFSPALLSLRGVAALMVLIFHGLLVFRIGGHEASIFRVAFGTNPPWEFVVNSSVIYLLNGHAAVSFFFVHSGFVLALSISHIKPGSGVGDHLVSWGAYFVRRAFRLFPMILVSCLCALVVQLYFNFPHDQPYYSAWFTKFYTAPVDFDYVLQNLFLRRYDLSPFLWSLRIEVYGSFLMPLIFLMSPRYWPVIVLTIVLYFFYPPAFNPMFVVCFVGGCLVGFVGDLPQRPKWFNRDVVSGCAAIVLIAARWIMPIWPLVVETIASAVIIYNVYYHPDGYLPRFCNLPFVKFMGEISFSVYVNSLLCIFICAILLTAVIPSEFILRYGLLMNWLLMTLSLSVNIAFSWITFRLVESPMMTFGRRLSGRLIRSVHKAKVAREHIIQR
jgi:peptidoglycan/LPS O-acetylase OafA/YrhL